MKKKFRSRLALLAVVSAVIFCMGANCPDKHDGASREKRACRPDEYGAATVTVDQVVPGIFAAGGNGVNGSGGAGGEIKGQGLPPLAMQAIGDVDTSFTVDCPPPVDLGPNPWVVESDYRLKAYDCENWPETPSAGEYFACFHSSEDFYRKNVYLMEGIPRLVSGMKLMQGVTLTVDLNLDFWGDETAMDTAFILFNHDVIINGVLSPASLKSAGSNGGAVETINGFPATSRDKGSITLVSFSRIYINGKVDAAGEDGVRQGARGGLGGSIDILSWDGTWSSGVIDCSGGNGGPGGDGGFACGDPALFRLMTMWYPRINLRSLHTLIQRGQVLARGGNGRAGGDGASIIYDSDAGPVVNLGTMNASGGAGIGGDGGKGGIIGIGEIHTVGIDTLALMVNQGELIARGGDADTNDSGNPVKAGAGGSVQFRTGGGIAAGGMVDVDGGDAVGWGDGGAGGWISLVVTQISGSPWETTTIRSQALFRANGGSGAGADSRGGNGGMIDYAGTRYGHDNQYGETLSADRFEINGGDGDAGGSGGTLRLCYSMCGDASAKQFTGLTSVLLSGGSGTSGGPGGSADLSGESINLSIPVLAPGGAGDLSAGTGGDGGTITLNSSNPPSTLDPGFDVSPGSAATPGAEGTVTVDGGVIYP